MKTGGGYLARLAARAATPAVAPQPILFNTEIAAPGLNPPPPPPVPREIALAPPPLPDAHPAAPPTVIAVSRSDPLAGPAESIPAPAPPEVMGQRKPGSPLPRPQVDRPLEAPAKPRVTRSVAQSDEPVPQPATPLATRGLDLSGRLFSRPIPQAAAASGAPPFQAASQPARVPQAAAPPLQPATPPRPAIELDALRSAREPATIPPTAKPAPPRPPEQPPRKSEEAPKGAGARREPIEAELSPSLEAPERITGLWQARAAQPSRESAAAPAATVTIGTLEVRVAAPPAPVPAPRRPPASPPAPLARGFRAFGLRQS